ncbi:MAG TPA: hypothetical protein VFK09_09975 [Gemmatimonadales bacterium]|nr:hypothetical protein [Gemmatimonadales bacterium]
MTRAIPPALEREVAERFAPADRDVARLMLAQYGGESAEPHADEVRRALLLLSRGKVALLGYYLAAAQHDHRRVLHWARHPDQAPKR